MTLPSNLAELAGTWTIDASHSRMGFVARHAMVTKVRGSFNSFEGSAVVADGDLNYPTITFTSTGVEATSAAEFTVTGDLTIKGVTREVSIPFTFEGAANDPFGNLRAGFEGSTVINRKDFGIEWNAALETGGFLVSEKITLEIEISAIKAA